MNPSEIRNILKELGGGANKRLGQHFLIDRAALETMVEHAPCHPGSLVLEIGPGLGVLTRELLNKGCDVIAIERDRRFVEYLLRTVTGDAAGPVTVISGDAAELDWMEIVGDQEWSLVSNLPYAITSLALRKALWAERPAEHVVVLVQREVAERAITLTPSGSPLPRGSARGSLLSLMVAFASESARIVRRVPPGAFFPPPKVESSVLEIVPMPWPERKEKWGINPEQIMQVAKAGFAHPRKKLKSNLIESKMHSKDLVERAFSILGIESNIRAERLSPEEWAGLAKQLVSIA